MYRYETHLHTFPVSACGDNTPTEMVKAYISMGYAGLIITDHFLNGNTGCPPNITWKEKMDFFLSAYHEARTEAARHDFDVFLGWEYAIHGAEFLTYGLGESFLYNNPDFHTLNIEAYSKLVRSNGGYLAQAHPYREAFWVKNPFPVAPHFIDGIESFNASQCPESNQKALDFARLHNLPIQAGTDAHNITPRFPSGIIMEERARTIHDIIAAIKNRKIELIVNI